MLIALFGDSITAGFVDGAVTGCFTKAIAQGLPDAKIKNRAIPGNTTADAVKRLEKDVLRLQPDVVVVFFGANDVATHHFVEIEQYRLNLTQIIQQIGSEKVLLIGPPACNQEKQGDVRPAKRLTAYQNVAAQLAKENQVPFIPLYNLMQAEKIDFWQADGLHFSEAGYHFLSEKVIAQLQKHFY